MRNKKQNSPFSYERGKCKLHGQTSVDRKIALIDITLFWLWRILLAVIFLIGALNGKHLDWKLLLHQFSN